jgi:quercetin dioxygenase-like cupin family protein
MRALLLAAQFLLACGGSGAEKPAPPRERARSVPDRDRKGFPPHVDCAGPKAWKCGGRARGRSEAAHRLEREAEPPKPQVPDAVEAGPRVYKVVVDNENVRVLLADYAPGSKVPMHRHPDHVVFAVEGDAAVFQKGGPHEVDGARLTATRAIIVELGMKNGSAVPAGDDPVAEYPRIFKLLVDQPRVRVLAVTFGKGTSRPVALGDHVLLSRDKGTLAVAPRGGSAQKLELEPGEVVFLPAGIYTATNAKKESFAVVLFELKP